MAGFIDENHLRKCWDCGTTNEHESRIVPGVLCPKCGSQDTRAIRADHKPKATPGCVMANDETRAAERLLGNCWDVYIGDPPRDWTEICDKILADGRAVATELDRLRAANAELAGAINAPLWLVWSNEHWAWWGPNGRNYYWGIESAGRYTLAEAQKICGMRGVERGNGINPPELVQPSPELIAMWDAALARHDAGKV